MGVSVLNQCIICDDKLSNSIAQAKLWDHFLKQHGKRKYKNTTFGEFNVKRDTFDEVDTLTIIGFAPIVKPVFTDMIAQQIKLNTIGETLLKSYELRMANIMTTPATK